MKRSKLCYGVLSALAIIFGWSLNVSSDTNALRYAYDAFPLFSSAVVRCTSDSNCQGTTTHNTSGFNIIFDFPNASSSNKPSSFDNDLTTYSKSGYDLCQTINNTDSIFYTSSISDRHQFVVNSRAGGTFNKQPLSSFYPSTYPSCLDYRATRWSYDHIYGSQYNLVTGELLKLVNISNFYFNNSDAVPGETSGSIKRITVPLNLANMTKVDSGSLMEWDFGLVGDPGTLTIDPNLRYTFNLSYYTLDPDTNTYEDFFNSWSASATGTCTVDSDYDIILSNGDLQAIRYNGLNLHCSFTAPSDLYYVSPTLNIYGSSGPIYNSSSFITWSGSGVFFSGTYFTTDGDDTWSGQIMNATPTGDNMENNPSYQQLYGDGTTSTCSPGDFICDLSNLFNFTFINPFEPILHLFTDSNQCASIPTIAGMIHSDETSVCPWFPSSVRNIATPVLGLASMMLVFGFAVRWLGSSSGNLFEDSRHEEVSNQGGRWGHFKKGGR